MKASVLPIVSALICVACQAEAPLPPPVVVVATAPAEIAAPAVAAASPKCPGGRHLRTKTQECVIDYAWLPRSAGDGIPNALNASNTPGGSLVCRAFHVNGVHPGRLEPQGCAIGWGGREVIEPKFEALIGPSQATWRKASMGSVPPGALPGGAENGYDLSICRVELEGHVLAGKVVGKTCSVGFNGQEVGTVQYEVLVGDD